MNNNRFYGSNDMAKIGCHDCKGCSSCCQDMGQSIWLDPYDVYHITKGLGKTMEQLLELEVELHVEDGLILPNLRMVEKERQGIDSKNILVAGKEVPNCSFLNEEGRCSIHAFRPGFCRLFPLGRNYDGDKLSYFILEDACPVPNKLKVKIEKWLNIPRIREYEAFLVKWHGLTKGLRLFYEDNQENDAVIKTINMQFLQIFYLTPYTEDGFYPQFEERMKKMQDFLTQLHVVLKAE